MTSGNLHVSVDLVISKFQTFRPVAVGALITTVVASVLVMVKESLDAHDETSCYYQVSNVTNELEFPHDWPSPTVEGFFKGYSSDII